LSCYGIFIAVSLEIAMKIRLFFTGIVMVLFCGCSMILESLFAGDLTVYIHTPSEYYQKTTSFTLSGTVYTKESVLERISVYVSPGGYTNSVTVGGGSWDIWVVLTEGANTVKVWATATNSVSGSSAAKEYFVDTVKPLITFTSAYGGNVYYNTNPVTFSGTITEANKITFFVYECSSGQWASLPKVSGSWSATITNPKYNSNYTFGILANDEAGWETEESFSFRVTNTNI
jgi:hypothetical protein